MAVPLLGIQKILLEYTNHPMAKGALTLIREDPNIDEEDKRMKMRIDNRAQAEAKVRPIPPHSTVTSPRLLYSPV